MGTLRGMVTMKRGEAKALVVVSMVAAAALSGCGSNASSGTTAGAGAGGVSSSSPAGGGPSATDTAPATPTTCPTENTRAFAKTRLVADLGLAAGTFHRYIYKPYKAGTFHKGAEGRTLALVKAGATAALDAKLLSNASKNIKANPTLCNALHEPMTQLESKLSALKGQISSGDLSAIESVAPLVSGVVSKATSNGLNVQETTDTSQAS